jgi:subtilisin family serine protease
MAQRTALPAWSLAAGAEEPVAAALWPSPLTPEWAWGDATGRGVRVAILDSGVEAGHRLVGDIDRAVVVLPLDDGGLEVVDDTDGDASGHGTACAGIIRGVAPGAAITSVRVLGTRTTGGARVLLAGLRWALEQRVDVINLSISTRKADVAWALHELLDNAYFSRAMVVVSAHNLAVQSYPWRFASVVSVGSHEEPDGEVFYANTRPPVEFFARGVDVEVAWLGESTIRATGNSFAAPHIAGLCARILGAHPGLTPFQVKTVLHQTASNVTS